MDAAVLKEVGITSDELRDMDLKPFKKLIANCDEQTREELKRLRRRLRNRGYANSARVRRDGESYSYETDIKKLRQRGDDLRREIGKTQNRIAATRAKLELVEDLSRQGQASHLGASSSASTLNKRAAKPK